MFRMMLNVLSKSHPQFGVEVIQNTCVRHHFYICSQFNLNVSSVSGVRTQKYLSIYYSYWNWKCFKIFVLSPFFFFLVELVSLLRFISFRSNGIYGFSELIFFDN